MKKCSSLFTFTHPPRPPALHKCCRCCMRRICLPLHHFPFSTCTPSSSSAVLCCNKNKVRDAKNNGTAKDGSKQKQSVASPMARAKSSSTLSMVADDHQQPGSAQLEDELKECLLDGTTVIRELERFIRHNGENLPKELPVDVNREQEGQEEGRERLDQFVKLVKAQYQLGARIEKIVPCLFEDLCSSSARLDGDYDSEDNDEQAKHEQCISKGFAKLVGIVVRFDTLKGATPALQNGFSLYRRLSVLDKQNIGFRLLHAYQADQISLFLARSQPLLSSLVNGTERFIGRWRGHSRGLAISHLTGTLLVIYRVLKHMVERAKPNGISTPNSDSFLRSMVGFLLLFDHIDSPPGLFSTQSPFDIVAFKQLVEQNANPTQQQQLFAILRHFSKNFKGPNTTASIRVMFGGG